MAEISGDGEGVCPAIWTPELSSGENGCNVRPTAAYEAVFTTATPPLTMSGSFKEGKSSRRRASVRPSLDADEFINLLHGSDPVKVELNRLENEVRGDNAIRSEGFGYDLDVFLVDFVANARYCLCR
uniref:Putative microtubule-associated protein 70-2 n=1 Tax=Davidia involucrata TaxID=16924 RepID=A0A5B6ZHG2_DAVIN